MVKEVTLILLLLSVSAPGTLTVWDYDLSSLPEGWTFTSPWEFTEQGAALDIYAFVSPGGDWGEIVTSWVQIPENCDSMVIHLEQNLVLDYGAPGGAQAKFQYRINTQGGYWSLFNQSAPYETTEPLHYSISGEPGSYIRFRFYGTASAGTEIYPGWGMIEWLLHDLTFTLYGEGLELQTVTWAWLKTGYGKPVIEQR